MAMTDILRGAQGGAAMGTLGRAFGMSADEASAVVDAVVPRLSDYLERNTLSRGGLADLVQALGHGHHEVYLDDPRALTDPATRTDGIAILDHIVGSKDRSRAIADKAEAESGVPAAVIRDMLPVLAGMLMGGLSKQVKQSLGDIGARAPQVAAGQGGGFLPRQPLPRGVPPPSNQGSGGSGGWGEQPRTDGGVRMNPRGGLEMPDSMPRQGYPDDSSGGLPGTQDGPLPMPGNRVPQVPGNADNPFGDLAEILRRGFGLPGGNGGPIVIPLPGGVNIPFPMPGGGDQGRKGQGRAGQGGGLPMPQGDGQGTGFPWPGGSSQGGGQGGGLPMPRGGQGGPLPMPEGRRIELPGGQVGGSMLWNIIRTILGSALGFQNRGVMSWIIRALLLKFAGPLLRTILGMGRR